TGSFVMGQGERPDGPLPFSAALPTTAYFDHSLGALVLRAPLPGRAYSRVAVYTPDSGMAFLDTANARRSAQPSASAEQVRRNAEALFPHWLLLSALHAPDGALRAVPARLLRGRSVGGVDVTLPNDTLRLWFD